MKENNSLALIVAYYLSKFDQIAYGQLGFRSSTATHAEIGRLLGVNPNSVKNMRDEFDPLHDNARVGWYQRPLRPSRAKVIESFQDLSEEELRDVVLEILTNPEFASSDDFGDIVTPIAKREKKQKGKSVFIVRGPTGRKAEEHFMAYHDSQGFRHLVYCEIHVIMDVGTILQSFQKRKSYRLKSRDWMEIRVELPSRVKSGIRHVNKGIVIS